MKIEISLSATKPQKIARFKPVRQFKTVIKRKDAQKFVADGQTSPGSGARKFIAKFLRDKAHRVIEALKDDVLDYRDTALLFKKVLTDPMSLDAADRLELRKIAFDAVTTVKPAAIASGVSFGLMYALPALIVDWALYRAGKRLVKHVGKAIVVSSEMTDEQAYAEFAALLADLVENADVPLAEILEQETK